MTEGAFVTESLAKWLCEQSFDSLPQEVVAKTIDVVYDSIGGMVACSTLPEVRAVVELVDQQGSRPECTIIGHRQQASLVNAAMANGGMAHGNEVDPVHTTSVGGHVAAGPVPTALAVGEWLNSSGKDVLRAVALGYEIGGRLMTIFYRDRDYVARRFYHTAIAANISSAVTAALLFGLDRQAVQVALCLATYQAAGPDNMTTDPNHMGKTFQVAAANRNGVTAALLARQGCFAPLDVLDNTRGLFDAYLDKPDVGKDMLEKLGEYYSIMDVMHKRYSAGTPNQAYLQGLFKIIQENAITPDDVDEIEIHVPKRGIHRVPTTRHASISAEKVSAIAVATGKLDFYFLHGPIEAVEATIKTMQSRIKFVGREDWTGMNQGRHAIVIVRTRDGRVFNEDVWHQPLDRAALEDKFRGLVTPMFGEDRSAQLKTFCDQLTTAESIRPLMKALQA
ncbi:MmgE/PrpD family protein [Starkeya sp. ORNL1]|uniref:MmgE/PrpD family protein n=1 Tax=Starkeya sp. ORNL1 TaxID=2709380 RepID=UPI001462DFE1|nr:MmgE/PrpD family protein [Starkeya sp. ORNL1]QJP12319.1 MmgE/PrpD family protein [Starkeya sp. ORNL1]